MKRIIVCILALVHVPALNGFPLPADAEAARWATIRGQVIFGGDEVPASTVLAPPIGWPAIVVNPWEVNPKNKGLKNVMVWLATDASDQGIQMPVEVIHPDLRTPSEETIPMIVEGVQFSPSTIILRSGQKFRFKNTLKEATNLRIQSNDVSENVLVPSGMDKSLNDLKPEKRPLVLSSNIHPWMRAHLRVLDHPYFAVTDEDGRFEIKLAPVGALRLYVWHPESGFRDGVKGRQGTPIVIKRRGLDVGTIPLKPID